MSQLAETPVPDDSVESKTDFVRSKTLRQEGPVRRAARSLKKGLDFLIGLGAMFLSLAIVSAIPVLNLLSLGFLLESSARVGQAGKMRSGFPGLEQFSRAGKIALGVWLWSLPLRLVHTLWKDAEVIQEGSRNANSLRVLFAFLLVVISLHLLAAILRGGRLRHFFFPSILQCVSWLSGRSPFHPLRGRMPQAACFVRQSANLLRLGCFGFLGAALWLAVPVAILFLASTGEHQGIAFLGSILGGLLLGVAALFMPLLQTRYAVSKRFRSFFEISEARQHFRRAPLAFSFALSATLLFALPLYLLKIELTPDEVAWLPNLLFVLFIFPARILIGWAYARAERSSSPRHWASRWTARLAALPVVAAYVFVVWLSQYLSWHGTYSLLEQHAFLVPAPLFGL